ncbi:hypothetical protein QFZ27_000136 [Inquilinus ginsengisoli]|uniref:hypothetical protein n=1 Tax=Inquilinus ginsengisoli TaxID=363840 RepID=UPI003D23B6C0
MSFACPVCGFPGLEGAPYDKHGCASFDICPCCGIEFGYDDATTSHLELRMRWIAGGKRWWSDRGPPRGWDADRQLAQIGE